MCEFWISVSVVLGMMFFFKMLEFKKLKEESSLTISNLKEDVREYRKEIRELEEKLNAKN